MAEQQHKKEKAMRLSYKNRKANIIKKGEELSTLCDVKVCVIVVSPEGKLETWPENLNDVMAVLSAVKGSNKPVRSEYNPKMKKEHEDLPKPITVNDDADVKGKDICIGNADQENNVEDEDIIMINNPNSICHSPTTGEMSLFNDQYQIGSSSGYTYEIGSCSYINSGVAHPNQPPPFF